MDLKNATFQVTFTALEVTRDEPFRKFKAHVLTCAICRNGSDPEKLMDRRITVCKEGFDILTDRP